LLGENAQHILEHYTTYNPNIDSTTSNVFAAAAYRFGHTQISGLLNRYTSDMKIIHPMLALENNFFVPSLLINKT